MFLTKKSILKIALLAISYFILGSAFFALYLLSGDSFLRTFAIIFYALCPIFVIWGRYAEGKGKLINLGNKLVRGDLKPAEFIKEYQRINASEDYVVKKPSVEVLLLVAVAYDCLGEREAALSAADEMIRVASDKKKSRAWLIKCSFLFSYGMTDEAEAIFNASRATKLDFLSQALADAIFKSDRAKALGDYKTVEAYKLTQLSRTFPKLDNLSKLSINYTLAEVYEKLDDREKAISHYKYCLENGGETELKPLAREALERLGKSAISQAQGAKT